MTEPCFADLRLTNFANAWVEDALRLDGGTAASHAIAKLDRVNTPSASPYSLLDQVLSPFVHRDWRQLLVGGVVLIFTKLWGERQRQIRGPRHRRRW